MVDHRIAHKGNFRLFWDKSNWQPMTRACNSRKAIREEGGFGRPVAAAATPGAGPVSSTFSVWTGGGKTQTITPKMGVSSRERP